jgi:general stress protein 26
MGNYERLSGTDAIEQLKEIVDHQRICMMVTDPTNYPPNSRPMAVAEVDDSGAFWFLALRTSEKFDDLEQDPRVTLHIANPSDQAFLTIHGNCEVLNEMARKKQLWSVLAKAWVQDGVDNPDLRVLKVTPTDGYYWDTEQGKVVAAVKIAFAMVTGNVGKDGGVEGPIEV